MPDLSLEAVHAFWHDYDRRTLYRIVTSLEGIESWAADTDPEVNQMICELGEALEEIDDFDISDPGAIVTLLANIHSSRALRIMQYLDISKPGSASQLLVHAEDNTRDGRPKDKYCELFLKRNLTFERLQLLARVFAPERINLVLRALESGGE